MCTKCHQYLIKIIFPHRQENIISIQSPSHSTTHLTSAPTFSTPAPATTTSSTTASSTTTSSTPASSTPYAEVDICMRCRIEFAEMTVLGGWVVTKACWILRRHKVHSDEENKNIVGMYAGVFCKSCGKFIILIQDTAISIPSLLRLCINDR